MSRDRMGVVLNLRERDEEAAQIVLRNKLGQLQHAENDLTARRNDLKAEQDWSSAILATRFDATDQQRAALRVEWCAQATIAAATIVNQAEAAVETARGLLATAQQRREVAERLRDRQRAIVRADLDRRDGQRMADVATVQHAMRGIEAGTR